MRSRKTLIISLAVFICAGVVGGLAYRYWLNSPRYALQQMALSLETKNMDKFFNYLDLQAIFNEFLEAASNEKNPQEKKATNDWDQLTRSVGRKFARQFLPKLFTAFEAQIRGTMEHYLLNLDQKQILGVAAAATVAKIEQQGDDARVTLTEPKSKEPLRFQMHRRAQGGHWQIVAVDYQDLKKFYRRELER
jgi:hypothetical protein